MKKLLETAIIAGIRASEEVLNIYTQGFSVSMKEDDSPVTTGDLRANEIISGYIVPTGIPVLSEESDKESESVRASWERYWCIDPIDGTKEYVNKTGEYCVSIGMLTPETSILGVLAAPSLELFYFAAEGIGSFKWRGKYSDLYSIPEENILEELLKNSIMLTGKSNQGKYTFLTSLSHYGKIDEEYYQQLKEEHSDLIKIQMGSAIKIGLVAEGKADEYARLTSVNFWDVAGGHAIAKYAGLELIDFQYKEPVNYKNISDLKISGYIVKSL